MEALQIREIKFLFSHKLK